MLRNHTAVASGLTLCANIQPITANRSNQVLVRALRVGVNFRLFDSGLLQMSLAREAKTFEDAA